MEHVPVLLEEVVRLLEPDGARLLVDGTVGGAGHAQPLLEAAGPDAELIGLDWDADALKIAEERFGPDAARVRLKRSAFGSLSAALRSLDVAPGAVDVILFDFGLSAFHVETPERGFSFRLEGPLDMRMDQRTETTAETLVNRLDAKALSELLFKYGGERKARAIARQICRERDKSAIRTTTQLAGTVLRAMRGGGRSKIHPATRTFQALRIAVNEELEQIESGVTQAAEELAPGGRLAAISYHSLEDRIVKVNFKNMAARGGFHVVTKKPIAPTMAERRRNARARSAKLRVLRKMP
jgi:16S rRNA (cytosine1402-N4)-methyltransferase